ncbi:unnamed protein product [Sphagnum troendelagicum]|uniref:Uncharacterized protein n=1 Tax=Sphagnum troendelagicum TaxID=128251 RepID=A0ABP0TAA2_9BRYO
MEQINQLQDTPAAVYDHTSSLKEDVISKVHIMRDPGDPQWRFADLQLHFIELRKNHKPDPQLLESKDACWCTQCIANDLSALSKSHAVSAEPQDGYLMSDQDLQDQPAHLPKVPSFGCEGEVLGHEVTFEAEDKIMEFNMFMELEDSFQNQLSDVVTALPQGQEVKVHKTCWDHQDYFLEYLLENDSKGKGGFEKLSICVGEKELGHELTFETEDDSMKLNMLWDLEDSENWVSEVDCTLPQVNKLKTHDTYRNHMLDSGSKLKGHNTCVGQAPTSSSRGKKEQLCSQKGHWFDMSIPGERKSRQKCESAHKSKRMVKYEKDRGYCTGVRSRCNGASFHTSLYWWDAKQVHSDNKRPCSGALILTCKHFAAGTYILESVAARVYDCMSLKLHPEKPPVHFPDADYSTDIQEAMNMTIPQYALFLKRKYASLSHGRRNKQCVPPSTPCTLSSEQVGE